MTVFNDIRSALETKVATVSGFPTARAWENVLFTPTTGTAWARMHLLPTASRPASRGDAAWTLHEGLFIVDLFYPQGNGMAAIEAMADAIRDTFTPSTVLSKGSTYVRFRWSERGPGLADSPWVMMPVRTSWYVYEP